MPPDAGEVPLVVHLAVAAYGWIVGNLWYAYLLAQRVSVKVEYAGIERLSPDENYIFCLWHELLPLALQASVPRLHPRVLNRPHAWMQHPSWAMSPIRIVVRRMGVERIILGSTGHGGRDAADEVLSYLKRGYSTGLSPDGPRGPARVLKKGVLHLSARSGVPIVPIRVTASRCIRSREWDKKIHPLPFSRIRVEFGTPMHVREETFDESAEALVHALG
jgi:lysophospholipid acyltransferase (LPLAT)-like uncharacterized protein